MCIFKFPHTREANSYFENGRRRRLGKRSPAIDTNFCQWLVPISLHSIFACNILSSPTRFTFRVDFQNYCMALAGPP